MQTNVPDTFEELHSLLSKDCINSSRIKFLPKILLILQYTKKHPEDIIRVGGAWLSDGQHFITNSGIIAEFLGLKANSINTNFRDHGFNLVYFSDKESIKKEFTMLTDIKFWKVRKYKTNEFNQNSTVDEVQKFQVQTINIFNPQFLPKELTKLNDQSLICSLCQIYQSLENKEQFGFDEKWYSSFINDLYKIWILNISSTLESDIFKVIDFLIGCQGNLEKEFEQQLRINLEYFMEQRDDCSQCSDTFTFDSFLSFFIKYGCMDDYIQTVKEITYFQKNIINLFNDYSTMTSNSKAMFVSWFSPFRNENLLKENNDWFIYPSKKVNVFSLQKQNFPQGIFTIHIYHNPTESSVLKRYSINFENEVKYSPTLDKLFTDILCLKYKFSEPNVHDRENKPIFLKHADQIIDSTNLQENENNNNKSNESLIIKDSFSFYDSQNSSQNSQKFMFDSQMFSSISDSQNL